MQAAIHSNLYTYIHIAIHICSRQLHLCTESVITSTTHVARFSFTVIPMLCSLQLEDATSSAKVFALLPSPRLSSVAQDALRSQWQPQVFIFCLCGCSLKVSSNLPAIDTDPSSHPPAAGSQEPATNICICLEIYVYTYIYADSYS